MTISRTKFQSCTLKIGIEHNKLLNKIKEIVDNDKYVIKKIMRVL